MERTKAEAATSAYVYTKSSEITPKTVFSILFISWNPSTKAPQFSR